MMRRPIFVTLPVLAGSLLLTACGGDNTKKGTREASGQVLAGSINDAMIPVDELQSQSPLAPPEPEKGPGQKAPELKALTASGEEQPAAQTGEGAGGDSASPAKPDASSATAPTGTAAQPKPKPSPAPKPKLANPDPIGAAVEANRR